MSKFAKLDAQETVVEATLDTAVMEELGTSFGLQYDMSHMNDWQTFVNNAFKNKTLVSFVKKQCDSIYKSKRSGNIKQRLSRGLLNRKVNVSILNALGFSRFNFVKSWNMAVGTNDIGDVFNIPIDEYCIAVVCRRDVQDHIECVFLVTQDQKGKIVVDQLEAPKNGDLAKIWFTTVFRK